eukprot:scaffold118286_cov76-Cyclotella_meneghiniana.AAC.3
MATTRWAISSSELNRNTCPVADWQFMVFLRGQYVVFSLNFDFTMDPTVLVSRAKIRRVLSQRLFTPSIGRFIYRCRPVHKSSIA